MTDRSIRLGGIFCIGLEMAFLNAAARGFRAIKIDGHPGQMRRGNRIPRCGFAMRTVALSGIEPLTPISFKIDAFRFSTIAGPSNPGRASSWVLIRIDGTHH